MANVFPRMASLKKAAVDFLFPRWCIGCGREGDFICAACRRSMPEIVPPVCEIYGRPWQDAKAGELCPACAGDEASIDGIRSPFLFEGLVRRAIHELKYRNLRALAPELAGMLHEFATRSYLPGDVLVPVPLHPRRIRERGYNQSALVARELGRLGGVLVVEGCLVRRGQAPPQVRSAGVAERRRNVAGAFICRDRRLSGRKVVLIDDVSTSGATLNSCAAVLKSAGAVSVWGLVTALEK